MHFFFFWSKLVHLYEVSALIKGSNQKPQHMTQERLSLTQPRANRIRLLKKLNYVSLMPLWNSFYSYLYYIKIYILFGAADKLDSFQLQNGFPLSRSLMESSEAHSVLLIKSVILPLWQLKKRHAKRTRMRANESTFFLFFVSS